jgi:uncharacterized protein YbaR (Trm112 family)
MSLEIQPIEHECTPYLDDVDDDDYMPCVCPVCKGFLTWDETGEIPICNKCGAELAKIPNRIKDGWECCKCKTINKFKDDLCNKCGHDECNDCQEPDYEGDGKICALSGRKKPLSQHREETKLKRIGKQNEKAWRAFL